jgi:hypothetical protein
MNKNTYLNYGVYKESILFMALGGNFASKAWTESDEAFGQIAGTSFQAVTADDAQVYNIGKYDIRRLKSDEEFEELLKTAHPAFRIFIKIEQLPKTVSKNIKWSMYQGSLYMVYNDLKEKYPNEDVEAQLYEYYAKNYGATPEEIEKENEEFKSRMVK